MLKKEGLISYCWNLTGSLAGILFFSFLSFLWTPPSVWLIFAALALMVFFYRDFIAFLPSIVACLVTLLCLSFPPQLAQLDVYSPYQLLSLKLSKDEPLTLKTSNTYYQRILDLRKMGAENDRYLKISPLYYQLPYYFKPDPKNVLIIGSGTGNDVAAALRSGSRTIDAVEIDPAILEFGKQLHPEFPYQAPNVKITVDDARAFIRSSRIKYDVIVYGLLDSHALLSGKGGIRLDSYVYTVEAFREARKKLKKGGIISLTFVSVNRKMGRKLFLMLQEAFDGRGPVVYRTLYDHSLTFVNGGGHLPRPPAPFFKEVTGLFSNVKVSADKSTDDWPFIYMPVRKYPYSYVVMIAVLLAISAVFIRGHAMDIHKDFSPTCFFLGAGFMLVETKAITELALVYGSTWVVTSVVIAGILIMAFLSNWLVIKLKQPAVWPAYGLLFLSLIVGLGLTFWDGSSHSVRLSRLIMTAVLTLPAFFSGFAFSNELKKATPVSAALSSNVLGAMLGGFLEYNSMYFGYRSLYVLAMLAYGFACLASVRPRLLFKTN
ncbi:MAG: spermidine synthase [Candidatus Omnitrophota bacterium]